ncbi:MAG TPA: hypothetical protein P5556_01960 [Candidatus Gastranaerophilales bacterium]|nr:hypothetical protein [Candidatus Gastranaerophilales bacterium]
MNKDFLKEKISLLKLWITLFMAVVVGSTAWIVNNWGKISIFFNIIVILTIIALIIIVSIINLKAYRLIKEMKKIGEAEK